MGVFALVCVNTDCKFVFAESYCIRRKGLPERMSRQKKRELASRRIKVLVVRVSVNAGLD